MKTSFKIFPLEQITFAVKNMKKAKYLQPVADLQLSPCIQ